MDLPIQNVFNTYNDIFYTLRQGKELKISEVKGIYPCFYEPDKNGDFLSYDGIKLTKIPCTTMKEVKERKTKSSYQADISKDALIKKFLINKVDKIVKSDTRWIVFDIETPIEDRRFLDPLKTMESPYPVTNIVLYDNYDKKYIELDLADFKNEFDMLDKFCEIIKKNQPDLLLAHNIKSFDYPYLYYRYPDFANKISPIGKEDWVTATLKYPALLSILDTMELDHKFTGGKRASYSLSNILIDEEFGSQSEWEDVDFVFDPAKRKEKCLRDVQALVALLDKNKYIETFDNIRLFSKCLWSDLPSEKIGWEWRSNNTRPWHQLFYQIALKQNKILPTKPTYTEEEIYMYEHDVKLKKDGAYRDTFKKGIFVNKEDK